MDGTTATTLIAWVQEHPSFVGGVVVVITILVAAKRRGRGYAGSKDPQRLFTAAQKAEGARRAGNSRCEHKAPISFRCSARGTHGDHIYPHSKGGATAMSNLQMLCATHNLRKSAHIPSAFYMWRLERRRIRYFPEGASPKVLWRIGQAS